MDVVTVCPFCLESVSPSSKRVQDPTDPHSFWHESCWMLEHAAEPIDFAGYDRAERDAAREAAWRARGGRRGAGL